MAWPGKGLAISSGTLRRAIPGISRQHGLLGARLLSTTSRESASQVAPQNDRIVFSGIQPTGVPHLGNYLGALKEWVRLQDTKEPSTKLIFSVVDLHALTVPKDAEQLRTWRREALAALLAVGLDPHKSTIFMQSAVPAHCELMWLLSTVSSVGYLSRMTQWKSKISVSDGASLDDSAVRAKLRLGLFSYPVLQAADILVHRATDVPVGEDQRQHIEFTRDTANSFNYLYGDVFTVPTALISPSKRVMSLKEPRSKMSKSDPDPRSRILLSDSAEAIHKKIKQALTDSEPNITFDRANRPGVSNLIEILAHIEEEQSPEEIAAEFHSKSMRVFKEHVAERLSEHLRDIRERYASLVGENASSKHLDDIAEIGARAARANADITMNTVKERLGL
ncbi:hypothetical protein KEM56_002796 [Ascosphaera pollenicola]|nr:hypothetical protein KEM56_002796 [Ascosphaera pollenicola]